MCWPQYLVGCILGLFLHEAFHVLAALVLGVQVKRIGVDWKGPYIVRVSGNPLQNILIASAGPAANIILYTLGYCLGFRTFAYVNLGMVICNLLPFKPSDGHRIVVTLRSMRRDDV